MLAALCSHPIEPTTQKKKTEKGYFFTILLMELRACIPCNRQTRRRMRHGSKCFGRSAADLDLTLTSVPRDGQGLIMSRVLRPRR